MVAANGYGNELGAATASSKLSKKTKEYFMFAMVQNFRDGRSCICLDAESQIAGWKNGQRNAMSHSKQERRLSAGVGFLRHVRSQLLRELPGHVILVNAISTYFDHDHVNMMTT